MAQAYRLRIELPDARGTLARIAAAVADHGGDVLAIDIHEVDGERAVDDIVVDAPADWDTTALAEQLAATGAGVLLACEPRPPVSDPVVRALRWATSMLDAGPHQCDAQLVRAVGEVCPSSTTWSCDPDEARDIPAGAEALARGGAIVARFHSLPAPWSSAVPGQGWLLAVPDGHLVPTAVVFLSRPVNQRFTASEVRRVEALLALCRKLSG